MSKRIILFSLALLCLQQVFATHISGGELTYRYIGAGSAPNTSTYQITLRLYRECNSSGAVLNGETVVIGIYNSSATLSLNKSVTLAQQWSGNPPTISNDPAANPCLSPPINVCYEIGTYSTTTDLPNSAEGYTLVYQRYTRIGLLNTTPPADLGATFITRIPGTTALPTSNNSSPLFVVRDTSIVCRSTSFQLDFNATDIDNDSLSYKFVSALNGFNGSSSNPNPFATNVPNTYQLIPLNYPTPYSGTSPLGPQVTINVNTGLITGVAPATTGRYVICVMAEEWRNGVLINTHRKDFILRVEACQLNGAQLAPDIRSCDGFSWTFENQSTSSNITSYAWSFGDGNSSTAPRPTHTYTDTGIYTVKLKVTSAGGCQDSATQRMHVFPGFFPGFTVNGSCRGVPFQFTDTTRTAYGVVNSWSWNFGDPATLADTSHVQHPAYTYPNFGNNTVQLIVTNSKGCIDTATANVVVNDKPQLTLSFKDTLICATDTLRLLATSGTGQGSFNWTPNYRISSTTDPNPLVNPLLTTRYSVTLNDRGCIATDTVRVNVIDSVTVDAGRDTTICLTDTLVLRPVSQALNYQWSPAATLNNPNSKNPIATPLAASTAYYVVASIGKCRATDSVTVKTVPYPTANAGADTTICYGETATLTGQTNASSFTWSPAALLQNPTSLITTAVLRTTTSFVLTTRDTLGCPKPFRDTVRVTVRSQPFVFAGNDTTIIINQPLVLQPAVSPFLTNFLWSPTTGMDSATALNPRIIITPALFPANSQITYRLTATSPEGCTASDDVVVKIFRTPPSVFVPNAFTPNGDGNNDILRPVLAGILRLDYFRVYNRMGQLVYSTSTIGRGWDGNINGNQQGSAGYVYVVQAVDYTGKVIKQSGSVVLIR